MAAAVVVVPLSADRAPALSTFVSTLIDSLKYYTKRARREEIATYGPAQLATMIKEDPASVLVAFAGLEIVGFCLSRYDDGLVWLAWFGVDERYRRMGIGAQLLAALEQTARLRNAQKVRCETRTENVPSQRLLSKFGFRQIGHLKNHGYGQDFFLWEKYPGSERRIASLPRRRVVVEASTP